MKRIIISLALSALIVSNISAHAGFVASAKNFASKTRVFAQDCGVKTLQGIKNHPYVMAATSFAALCAASVACNEYAKANKTPEFIVNKSRTPLKLDTPSWKIKLASRLGFVGKALDALKEKYFELTWDDSYFEDKK